MKSKKKDLKVDYIGGEGSLTLAEEEAITQYLTKSRSISKKTKKKIKPIAQHTAKSNR